MVDNDEKMVHTDDRVENLKYNCSLRSGICNAPKSNVSLRIITTGENNSSIIHVAENRYGDEPKSNIMLLNEEKTNVQEYKRKDNVGIEPSPKK